MHDQGSPRLLVVDDDASMVSTLRDILVASGYRIDVAYSGEEAIERATEQTPDCILMDIRLPGLDGVAAYRQIRSLAVKMPVIFITGYSDSGVIEKARAEGDVLVKPIDLDRLFRLLEEACGAAGQRGS